LARHIPYEENHREINGFLEKKCSKHDIYFPDEDSWFLCTEEYFYKNKSSSRDGLNTWCKKCSSKKAYESIMSDYERFQKNRKKYMQTDKFKKWRIKNEEEYREWNKQWRIDNKEYLYQYAKEREKHKKHKISSKEWNECKKYFNHRCAYCGLALEDHYIMFKGELIPSDFHKEHVYHFGKNDLSNCVPACRNCNSYKWEFEFEDWYKKQPFFTEERYNKILEWINKDYMKYIK